MLKGIVDRLFQKEPPIVTPYCPPGSRIYCVGDIHGRADLLQEIHDLIEADSRSFEGVRQVVYLGDYVDRGMQSREVVEMLSSCPLPDSHSVFLRGNHDQYVLDFLEDPARSHEWFAYGGQATLISYGVGLNKIPGGFEELDALRRELQHRLPASHHRFLSETRSCYTTGSYYFVHAGIRPGLDLDRQTLVDQLFIRDEFTSCRRNFQKIIVHGHTITERPEVLPNRIGIDTGAFSTGILTCLVLEKGDIRFIQTGGVHP